MRISPKKLALWISIFYGGVALLWIWGSDALVRTLAADLERVHLWQNYKGVGFVLGTTALLYGLLRLLARRLEAEQQERLAATAALRDREKLLARAQGLARLGAWTFDLSTGLIHASAEGAALVGWQPGAHPAEKLFALVHPEDVGRVRQAWEAKSPTQPYEVEHRLVVNGAVRWVAVRGEVEVDAAGQPARVVGITQDITERKLAEAALAKSEERYRNLTEQAADAFFVHDETGRFLEVNRRGCDSLGYTAAELLTMNWCEVEQEFDPPALRQMLQQLRPGQAKTMTGTHRRKDGSEFPVEVRVGCFEADGRRLYHSLARDITDRKRAADALEMFRTLVDRVNDAIAVLDPETGRFMDINEKACLDLAYAREELLSLRYTDVDPWTDEGMFRRHRERLWESGALLLESTFQRKDGTSFPVEVNMKWVWLDRDYIVAVVRDISERRKHDAALRSSEERLRACIDNTPNVAVQWYDEPGRILFWNRASEAVFGWRGEEVLGRQPGELFLPAAQEALFRAMLQEVAATGQALGPREFSFQHRAGGAGICLATLFAIPGPDGRQQFVCMVVDITERKRVEDELRRSQQQYVSLVNNVDGIVWEVDLQSKRTTFISSQVERILGVAPERWLGAADQWRQLVHPEDRDWVLAQGREFRQRGEPYDCEYRMIAAGGRVVWIHNYVSMELDAARQPVLLRGVMVDVTERRMAEEELRRREERFRMLIENASDIVTVVNAQGVIRFQSPSVARILGLAAEEMTGRAITEYLHPEDAGRLAAALQRTQAHPGLPVAVEYRHRHLDGSWRFMQSVGRSVPGEAADGFVIVNSRDITETRKLEEQFRQSQKMEAIGQLAGGVAHDLNNILTVVHMQLDLLKHGDPLTPAQLESVVDIDKASRRAADLTRQLLMFSRRQAALKQNLDLNNVVTNITKMLQRIMGEDVTMEISYAPQPLPVHADSGMLDQVLLNLAVNSRDAMPGGGKLVIETEVVELDELAAAQRVMARPGRFACLAVSDTGKGISAEVLPRIFEPFFTTKDVGKGTGLGLATVFGILQQHHGWINVTSEVGSGTTFKLFLPLVREAEEAEADRPVTASLPGGSETILLVEDEQSLRVLVRNVLTRLGYRVLEATSGRAAIEVWREHRAEIRLLLTDLVMPDGLTGKQLAEELLRQNPQLRVVFSSGYSREIAGQDFPLQDGVNFLSKPFQAAKLASTVRNQLDAVPPPS